MKTLQQHINEKLKINKDFKFCDDFYYESPEEIAEEIINTFGISDKVNEAIKETVKVLIKNEIDKVHCRNMTFTTEDRYIKYLPEEMQDKYSISCKEYNWQDTKIHRYYISSDIPTQNISVIKLKEGDYKLYWKRDDVLLNHKYLEIACFMYNHLATYICTLQT